MDRHQRMKLDDVIERYPDFMSPKDLAQLLSISRSTLDQWKANGRLEGTYRKRGKHVRYCTRRVLEVLFNGKEWGSN